MNSKTAIALVVIIVIIAAFFLLTGKTSSQQKMVLPTTAPQIQTSPTESTQTATGNTVAIENFAFSPATLSVKDGDTVTWTNKDSAGHSATADDGSFDTGVLSQGQSGSFTFTKAGTFSYHCSVHPNMTGTITVK